MYFPLSWIDKYLDDDRILIDIFMDFAFRKLKITPQEVAMSEAIKERLRELGERAAAGESIPYQRLYDEVNDIAESFGCEYGIPVPASGEMKDNHLVMAPGVPLRHIIAANQQMERQRGVRQRFEAGPREAALEMINSGVLVRNSWDVIGDQTVCVLDTPEGPMFYPRYHAVQRMAKLIRTLGTRMESHLSVEAELRAQQSLKAKINDAQWRCYVLNDAFMERSPRSDLHYVFRKGYPTLVISHHGYEGGRALAALCLHPMGFFQYTHAGLMTPTDEVICHLLMMRADEHKFWAKSGQWRVTDTRSGI